MLTYIAAALIVLLPLATALRGGTVHTQLGFAAGVLAASVVLAGAWQLVAPETAAAALRPGIPVSADCVLLRTRFLGVWVGLTSGLALAHLLLARRALAPPRGAASGLVLLLAGALATNQATQVSADALTRYLVPRQGIDGMATGMRIAINGMDWGLIVAQLAALALAVFFANSALVRWLRMRAG